MSNQQPAESRSSSSSTSSPQQEQQPDQVQDDHSERIYAKEPTRLPQGFEPRTLDVLCGRGRGGCLSDVWL